MSGARRLRVVQVSFHADVGRRDAETLLGAWPTLPAVASAVARAGVDVAVVQAAHADRTLERDGVAYHFVDDPGAARRERPARLLARAASLAPDVVHVQGLNHPRAVRQLGGAVRGVPVLVQDHGTVPPVGWRRAAWRWAYRAIAGVAFTAREQAAPFVAAGALGARVPVHEVLEGSSTFAPGDQAAARRATGMAGDPCVLWTGRLDANKDPLAALDAFERAAPRLPDARLWCCWGRAPLLDAVRTRVAASEVLRARVTLVGPRPHDEMEHRFRAADLFVQTSHREGSGYSLLEALACGTPAIVTDIPAARRIVGDASWGAGALVSLGNPPAMADALVAWSAGDRGARRRAARRRFDCALTYEAVGRELRTAYEAVAR